MKIIIGLGNPGKDYQNTWHNIGFLGIDEFWKKHNFPEFSFSNKFNAYISEDFVNSEKIILAKPNTYMNESGKAAASIIDYYKSKTSDLIIIHDDIDLLLGKIKISAGRGSAGHKGVESIFNSLGGNNLLRIRIGISPNLQKDKKAMDFVLRKIGRGNKKIAKDAIEKTEKAIETLLSDGPKKAMADFNK